MPKQDNRQMYYWTGPVEPEHESQVGSSTALLIFCMLPIVVALLATWYWNRLPPDLQRAQDHAGRQDRAAPNIPTSHVQQH
jgi:hypothetical protein